MRHRLQIPVWMCPSPRGAQPGSESHFAAFVSHNLSYCGYALFVLAGCVLCGVQCTLGGHFFIWPALKVVWTAATGRTLGLSIFLPWIFPWKPARHRLIGTSARFANIWLNPVSAAGRHVPINYPKRESLNSWQWPHARSARQHTLHTLFVLVLHFLSSLALSQLLKLHKPQAKSAEGTFDFPPQ